MPKLADRGFADPRLGIHGSRQNALLRLFSADAPERQQRFVAHAPEAIVKRRFSERRDHCVVTLDSGQRLRGVGAVRHVLAFCNW